MRRTTAYPYIKVRSPYTGEGLVVHESIDPDDAIADHAIKLGLKKGPKQNEPRRKGKGNKKQVGLSGSGKIFRQGKS